MPDESDNSDSLIKHITLDDLDEMEFVPVSETARIKYRMYWVDLTSVLDDDIIEDPH